MSLGAKPPKPKTQPGQRCYLVPSENGAARHSSRRETKTSCVSFGSWQGRSADTSGLSLNFPVPKLSIFTCTPITEFLLKCRFIFASIHTFPELVFGPLRRVRWSFLSVGEGTPADPAYCCLTNTVSSLFIAAYKIRDNRNDNTDLH